MGTNLEAVYIVYTADGACAAFEDATNKFEPGSVRVQSGAHCYEDVCRAPHRTALLTIHALP